MTTYSRRATRTLLFALSAAVVASTLTAAPAAAGAAGGGAPGGVRALAWKPCAQANGPADQECARLPVPLDYRDPDGRQLTLAVSRLRSDRPQARRGTLLVIAGGPGGSGVQRLTLKGAALRKEMGGAYDIVSFDPRGVGGSTTASCGLDEGDRHMVTLRPWPGEDGGITSSLARARRVADACDRNGGAVLRSFTTANEVRDIDRFRRALGEDRLSAWGSSYGTYVGAVYAQKYPQHTDRWVLDSSGDPDPSRVARGWLANMSAGAEDRFPDFAAWAADPARDDEGLRPARRPEDVRPLVLALAAQLDREPRASQTPGTPLTGNRLRQALQNALYSDKAFPQVARLIKQARDQGAEVVLTPDIAKALSDQDAAVTMGVICNDVRWPAPTASSLERAVAADRARYPLTAGMPVNVTPCAFWKREPVEKPTRITGRGPSNILMVQSLRDPATPYAGALRMREALGDRARLVTVGHGGHGLYLGDGNACGDREVTRFLTTGHRPARDTYCAD
ncbi:alpha/beta fold hydrolase [Streptomyces sp. ISL-99]|uniref:alpha/beta hydrolase n=1 Tax=Streptomyces sp. ISL-99 TaxID=2819193 RepID=UPI001BE71957|nr:alpha/beta hydrolase [Streptomyces sp. ISL-99]MBT2527922.1 alpha/beta fold hydrolase [Streptomyces sp. ISL-99]